MILLVEDDDDDVFLMERALQKAHLSPKMHRAKNGQEAIEYLEGKGKYADRLIFPLPQLIFLDLKLPFVHGFEVLKWIREHPATKEIHVAMLTSSLEDTDRERAERLGANDYYIKPPKPEMLIQFTRFFDATKA